MQTLASLADDRVKPYYFLKSQNVLKNNKKPREQAPLPAAEPDAGLYVADSLHWTISLLVS